MSKIDHNIYTILATTQYESLPFSSYTSLAKYDDYNTLEEMVQELNRTKIESTYSRVYRY